MNILDLHFDLLHLILVRVPFKYRIVCKRFAQCIRRNQEPYRLQIGLFSELDNIISDDCSCKDCTIFWTDEIQNREIWRRHYCGLTDQRSLSYLVIKRLEDKEYKLGDGAFSDHWDWAFSKRYCSAHEPKLLTSFCPNGDIWVHTLLFLIRSHCKSLQTD